MVLALESQLPNEIDWALNKLVHFSYVCPEQFSLAHLPPLTDALLEHAQPFFEWVQNKIKKSSSPATAPVFAKQEGMLDDDQLERLLQLFHIFRNMSFLDSNRSILLAHPGVARLVECGLLFADDCQSPEVKRHALDIYENLSTDIKLRGPQDRIYHEVKRLVFSEDKALVTGAIRSLTHLCVFPPNEEIFKCLEKEIFERFWMLLLSGDETIISEIMEFLYQYTSLYSESADRMIYGARTNVVRLLVKFLMWRGHSRSAHNQVQRVPSKPSLHLSADSSNITAASNAENALTNIPDGPMSSEIKACAAW